MGKSNREYQLACYLRAIRWNAALVQTADQIKQHLQTLNRNWTTSSYQDTRKAKARLLRAEQAVKDSANLLYILEKLVPPV